MYFMGIKGFVWAWPLILGFCFLMYRVDKSYDKKSARIRREKALKKLSTETGLTVEEIETRIARSQSKKQ